MPNVVLNCPILRELDIAYCRKLTDAAIRSSVTSCPLLESLDMTKCPFVSDDTLREISLYCEYVQTLVIICCPNIALRVRPVLVHFTDACVFLCMYISSNVWSFLKV